MTAEEIFTSIMTQMRVRVLMEHSYGGEEMVSRAKEKIEELRLQLIDLMPEARRDAGTEALDNDLERLYSHFRAEWDNGTPAWA